MNVYFKLLLALLAINCITMVYSQSSNNGNSKLKIGYRFIEKLTDFIAVKGYKMINEKKQNLTDFDIKTTIIKIPIEFGFTNFSMSDLIYNKDDIAFTHDQTTNEIVVNISKPHFNFRKN